MFLIVLLLLPLTCFGGNSSPGRLLYDQGKYAEALERFQTELSQGPQDSAHYYNVGTAYYRLSQYGMAVAYFEKAGRVNPHDSDIQNNLALARSKLAEIIGPDRLDHASTALEQIADHASLDEIRGTLGIFAFAVTLFWIRSYRKTKRLRRTLMRPTGVLGMIALLITSLVYGAQRLADSHPPAVSIAKEVIRSGPGDTYAEVSRLEPGMKVRLLGPEQTDATHAEWRQIRYSQDDIGWIRASSILLL